jgi:hypothetical protein
VIRIRGWINVYLVGGTVAVILLSAAWRPNVHVEVGSVDLACRTSCATRSSCWSPSSLSCSRRASTARPTAFLGNRFAKWQSLAGIFVCLTPVLAMLGEVLPGPESGVLRPFGEFGAVQPGLSYSLFTTSLSGLTDNIFIWVIPPVADLSFSTSELSNDQVPCEDIVRSSGPGPDDRN